MSQEKCGICNVMVDCPEGDLFAHWREYHPVELKAAAEIAKKIIDRECKRVQQSIYQDSIKFAERVAKNRYQTP